MSFIEREEAFCIKSPRGEVQVFVMERFIVSDALVKTRLAPLPKLCPSSSGSGNFGRPRATSRPVAMSMLSPHKSWDGAMTSSGRSQAEGHGSLMDMSPSRGTNVEFDLPTPTRRKMSSLKGSSFDTPAAARQQRENVILDEVSK